MGFLSIPENNRVYEKIAFPGFNPLKYLYLVLDPVPTAICLSLVGFAMIALARCVNVLFLTYNSKPVGFLHALNWSVFYTLIGPAIVLGMSLFYRSIRDETTRVLFTRKDPKDKDMVDILESVYRRPILRWGKIGLLILLIVLNVLDYFDGLRCRDWANAYEFTSVSPAAAISFSVFCYAFQYLYTAAGAIFLLDAAIYLVCIYRAFPPSSLECEIVPDPGDGFHKFGLKPLGDAFTRYTWVVVAFGFYLVLLRYHQVQHLGREWDLGLIVMSGVPCLGVAILVLLPLAIMHERGRRHRNRLQVGLQREFQRARSDKARDEIRKREELLEAQSLWPMSYRMTYVSFGVMIALAMLVVVPPSTLEDLIKGLVNVLGKLIGG